MTYRTSPYLNFPGNAEEALTYYQSIFCGELEISTYDDMDTADFPFTPPPNTVAHGDLRGPHLNISGGDDFGPERRSLQERGLAMTLYADTVEEAREIIGKLTDTDATIELPFEQAPWGDWYGQVKDRFGVLWHISATAAGA